MVVLSDESDKLDLLSEIADRRSKLVGIDPQIIKELEELQRLVTSPTGRETELMRRVQELERELVPAPLFPDDSGAYSDPSDTKRKRLFCGPCFEKERLALPLEVTEEYSQCKSCGSKYQSQAQKRVEQERLDRFKEACNGVNL